MAGLVPLRVTAVLQQGVAMDLRYGIALDGLLTGQVRGEAAYADGIAPGSNLDGGLAEIEPHDWDLPLARCVESGDDWHWLCTTGLPQDHSGNRVTGVPDAHRLLGDIDERRAAQVAVSMPKNVGGARGRFRRRITPVLVFPAARVVWHAVGDHEAVQRLLEGITTVGARRGSGEGTVISWLVETVALNNAEEQFLHGHLHADGVAGRPMPMPCATRAGVPTGVTGLAGLRPPMFHAGRQKVLVLPDLASARKESNNATS
jgi:CRISPR type IV-associated protein Csf3